MLHWPIPKNIKQLHGILSLTGYYRCLTKYYAFAANFLNILEKDSFCWNKDAQISFHALKGAMTQATFPTLPDFNQPF